MNTGEELCGFVFYWAPYSPEGRAAAEHRSQSKAI